MAFERAATDGSATDRTGAARVRRRTRLRSHILPCLRTSLVSGSLVLVVLLAVPTLIAAAALSTFRSHDPPGSMLMLAQRLGGQSIDQRWVPLSRISPTLVRAVIVAEDRHFCRHDGIDRQALATVFEQAEWGDEPTRGGSTITMQVAKNMFLWSSRSVVRKAIEIPLALAIDRMWTKQRTLEIYLNVAEWGPGIFGAEAAAQYHFRKSANRLSEREAALLAASLPNPLVRVASRPTPHLAKVAGVIEARARSAASAAHCILGR